MAVSILACNLALGELRADAIADIAEDTPEARECSRYYQQCLDLLLERHDWSFATRVAALAALAVSPSTEWAYAFALPSDYATPRRLVPSAYYGRPIWTWPDDYRTALSWRQPYAIEGGTFFTDTPDAVLEYGTSDPAEAAMSALFLDALSYHLAARLAVPLRDDRKLKGELLQQAEIATQRAVADDRNRQPQRDETAIDEVALSRGGGI